MDTVALGQTGRRTTRLGFGCSSLLGSMNRRESMATLEAAFDAGIRHFDVAPSYGYGEAESCLGEFLARHLGQATVATKYGIAAPGRQSLVSIGRGIVKPLVKLLPGAKRRISQAASRITSTATRPAFLAAPARMSLDRSLRALKCGHIDLWLLHEVEASDISAGHADELLELLQASVASGKIGGFGIASGREKVSDLVTGYPALCRVRQYEWSVLDAPPEIDGVFRIHHRSLTDNFRALHEALIRNEATAAEWSARTGVDLSNRDELAALMLKSALALNPESVILFSSKSARHIAANAHLAESGGTPCDEAVRTFYALMQEDGLSLLEAGLNAGLKARAEAGLASVRA